MKMNIITPKISSNQIQRERIRKNNTRSLKGNLQPSYPLSFKGGSPAALMGHADKQILNVFSQHYGNIGNRLVTKVDKLVTSSDILKKSSRFASKQGALSIGEKKVGRALLENIIFPFVNLPLYAVSWVLKKVQSVPSLKTGARKIYNKPLLRIPRKLNELDAKTDMLKGIFDKTQDTVKKFAEQKKLDPKVLMEKLNDTTQANTPIVKEANEFIKENLYKVSNKFFDKHTGNFNTAFERPLNRIVTGLIPVLFLANDAYNLSVLCGDTKEESKKEANERKKQEISRVFTTAYFQLLTFGAFTKQVNTIPWFTPLTSAATVLFSEITSRKRLGKPVLFLSKEKAKEYNKRDAAKKGKKIKENKETKTQKTQETVKSQNNNFNLTVSEPKVFTSFKASTTDNKPETAVKTEKKKDEPKKALINFNTFKKGVAILVSAGFVLSFLKNSSYTKNSKIIKGLKSIGDSITKKIYNPLAYKDFEITKQNFDQLTKSLKDAGCEKVAEGHEFIKNKYGRQMADGTIKMYKGVLSASKIPDIIKATIERTQQQGTSLSEKERKQIAESLRTAIGLEGTSIAEKKYANVANKAVEIIKNKKLNLNSDQLDDIAKTITEAINSNAKEVPIQIETKLKPFVDIVTQPFKFIMSAAKLPFKITSSLIQILASPVEKKAAQAALGKAELSKAEQTIHKAVTEIFGEKKAKAGKISQAIFANAMEQLEKNTMPYRKAEAALKQAIKEKQPEEEIRKLKSAMDAAKQKLLIYVNTAVEKSFNGVTQSSNKNTDLAMMSKLASSAVTSAFLVADNYNMVMLKSDGEDKDGAKEKANERIIQRLSALFYQSLLINWFNSTFKATYNSSLKGMAAVAIPNTITTEVLTRKSIGMPIGRKTMEELQEIDEKNENRTGLAGKYFKFMRLLTGKKPLKDRLPKDKAKASNITVNSTTAMTTSSISKGSTTNLLELFSQQK